MGLHKVLVVSHERGPIGCVRVDLKDRAFRPTFLQG